MEILKTRRDSAPPKVATLLTGWEINQILISTDFGNGSLNRIIVSRKPPEGGTQDALISTGDSETGIWLWHTRDARNAIIRLYFVTGARRLYFNPDSEAIFAVTSTLNRLLSVQAIDLSSHIVSFERIQTAAHMFHGLENVGAILAHPGLLLPSGAVSTDMFNRCYSLIGGAGTAYDSSHEDGTYARIDNPPDSPGYFTEAT